MQKGELMAGAPQSVSYACDGDVQLDYTDGTTGGEWTPDTVAEEFIQPSSLATSPLERKITMAPWCKRYRRYGARWRK